MNGCSLGVHAFRSSVQAAAHHLTRPCSRLLPAAPLSSRCFSSWPAPQKQQRQQLQRGGHGHNAVTGSALLKNARPVLPQWVGIRTILGGRSVITHYVDLPPGYEDQDGLPFAKNDLTASEIFAIFGSLMSTTGGNELLRILHGRRVAGTLDDPMLRVNTRVYSKEQQTIALAYLREHVPVDEIANAGLRAEDELAALENGGTAVRAEETDSDPSEKATKFRLYGEREELRKKSVYGRSALDAIRERNKAKWEAEMKRREEEKKKQEEEQHKVGPVQVLTDHQPRQLSAKMQEYMIKGQSDLKEPPQMKLWQRLLPSAAVVLALTGLCVAYAEFYQPAKRAARWFPDIPPAAVTVGALIALNVVGWGLWKIPPLWGLLNQYFIVVIATPRALTMLSAMFSHQSLLHLAQNMFVLWFLGVRFHDDVGRGSFLATYFASGAVAAFGTLSWAAITNRLTITSLGASGAIYGVGAAYLWLHRFEGFRILGLPPPPRDGVEGLTLLAFATALNIGAAFTARRNTMDITGHLVGLCSGVLAGHLIEKKRAARSGIARPTKVPVAAK
ncbi:hypothetical protein F5144DRAFT_555080 [Chaetomium tenue]|uniref:Uncharacterized protein n=1 Tax=Chaetomium tenue TaxID=1854479 RepID=A0ACB7PLQ0_9PEZI|nr:hypothetical protein F5144DRAFT_555080 [Chaetomium globosum]